MERKKSPIEKVLSYNQCPNCDSTGESRASGGYRCRNGDCQVATFESDGTVAEIKCRAKFGSYTVQRTVDVQDDDILQDIVGGDA